MPLVEQYGNVYKLTDAKYNKLLELISQGREYDLDELGKDLGEIVARPLRIDRQEAAVRLHARRMGR